MKRSLLLAASIALSFAVTSCKSNDSNTPTINVTGAVMASLVEGSTVSLGNASATTAADGTYSLDVAESALAEVMLFTATGGTFTDESTGAATTLGGNGLQAAIAAGDVDATNNVVVMTPASTIVAHAATNSDAGLAAGLAQANADFEAAFGYAVDTATIPANANDAPAGTETDAELLAGLRAAAFSELTNALTGDASTQADVLEALGQDLSDGTLDGQQNGTAVALGAGTLPADIQNKYENAYMNFYQGGNNQTGLGPDQIDSPPFSTVATSASYKVTYVAGMMDAMQGKTMFSVTVTDLNGNALATAPTVSMMPMMYMNGMSHTTPDEGCVNVDATTWNCTIWYLMASGMNGMSMGYWDLGVKITDAAMNMEMVHFYPDVMMAMGDTAKATLKGQADTITNMMGMPEGRKYHIFKETVDAAGNTFGVYVAVMESMMSMPELDVAGMTLNAGTASELIVTTVLVEASLDGATWITLAAGANPGHYTVTNFGLTAGTTTDVFVRLIVNGEQKTTDGAAPAGDGTNDYATFTVTP